LASAPLLEIQAIAFERDDRTLFSDVSVCLAAGEIMQVSGPNGCGKTTLLHILATLKPPAHGQMLWRGDDIRADRFGYLADIAFIGHQPGLKLALSARENLIWCARLHGLPVSGKIDMALDRAGLSHCKDVPCSTLSAGQLRRVALAVLHLREALLWLLDEPLTALDHEGISELEAMFRSHLGEGGIIVFSSHQALSLAGVRNLPLTEYAASLN